MPLSQAPSPTTGSQCSESNDVHVCNAVNAHNSLDAVKDFHPGGSGDGEGVKDVHPGDSGDGEGVKDVHPGDTGDGINGAHPEVSGSGVHDLQADMNAADDQAQSVSNGSPPPSSPVSLSSSSTYGGLSIDADGVGNDVIHINDSQVHIGEVHMSAADVIDPNMDSMHIDVANIERATLDGAHIEDANITAPLTDAQFNMLFSHIRALGASANENPPRAQMDNHIFTTPAFISVQHPSATLEESLRNAFLLVPPDTVGEIIHFEFFPADLYKLDPILSESMKDYSTLAALMRPLFVYFQILGCYAASSNNPSAVLAVHRGSLAYCTHLLSLNETYEWPAILQYHTQFFYRRSREMARGNFLGWQSPDNELMGQLLFRHIRPQPSSFLFLGSLILHICLTFFFYQGTS